MLSLNRISKTYKIGTFGGKDYVAVRDVTFDIKKNKMEVHHEHAEPWRVTLADTGEPTAASSQG